MNSGGGLITDQMRSPGALSRKAEIFAVSDHCKEVNVNFASKNAFDTEISAFSRYVEDAP
jgi:hypothetical protein